MMQARRYKFPKTIDTHYMGDFAKLSDVEPVIHFNELGLMPHARRPHRHSFYVLLHIVGGEGLHIVDTNVYPIKPGIPTICLLSPSQAHFWDLSKELKGTAIRFTDDLFIPIQSDNSTFSKLDFQKEVIACSNLYIPDFGIGKRIERIINIMKEECENNKQGRNVILIAYLNVIVMLMYRLCRDAGKCLMNERNHHQNVSTVNRFRELVYKNFLEHRNVSWYANRLGISEGHLHDVIKKETGLPPGNIIRKELTAEAKRLLAHTELTVSEICYKLNYDDPSYFSRVIKRETGMNPTALRHAVWERYHRYIG